MVLLREERGVVRRERAEREVKNESHANSCM